MDDKPIAAGKSSFDLVDREKVFPALHIQNGERFLDLACGYGHYALYASQLVGREGIVYAVDLWKEGIEFLSQKIRERDIRNIKVSVSDVSREIPVESGSIDICFIATVLHDLIQDETDTGTMKEVQRVLTAGGRLAIIEFRKMQGPPGPPVEIRLSPEELNQYISRYGFRNITTTGAGEYTYLSLFSTHL
jgi:ubiquinone/menaquinone biosynthesis C-methylase UbiE